MNAYPAGRRAGSPAPRGRSPAGWATRERLRVARERKAELFRSVRAAAASLRSRTRAQAAQARGARITDGDGHGEARDGHGDAEPTRDAMLPLDVRAPCAARTILQGLDGRIGPSALADAELVASELVTNSVRHSGASADESARLRVWISATRVRLEVWDPGTDRTVAARSPALEDDGGFGLNIVRAVSERWGLEQDVASGTRVWAELAHVPSVSGHAVAGSSQTEAHA